MIKVYIATSNLDEGKVLELAFKQFSYKVLCSPAGMSNYLEMVQYKPDIVMIELGAQYMDSLSSVKLIRQNRIMKGVPILCYGNHKHLNVISHIIHVGVTKYFLRPLKIGPLIDFIYETMSKSGKTVEKVELQSQNHSYDELEDILTHKKLSKSEKLNDIIAGLGKLLSFPFAITRIVESTDSDDTGAKDLAKAISSDAAITASILKISNSVEFHSQNREINDLSDAIVRIGFNEIKNIALGLSVMKVVENTAESIGFDRTEFWFHSLGVAIYAERIAKKLFYPNPSFAFLAGLLHEFGNLILDEFFEKPFDQVIQSNTKKAQAIETAQQEAYNMDHIDLALALFQKWKLPSDLVAAVAHYLHFENLPDNVSDQTSNLIRSVGIAEILTKASTIGQSCDSIVRPLPASIMEANHLGDFISSSLQQEVYRSVESFATYLNLPPRSFPDPEIKRGPDAPKIAWVDYAKGDKSAHKIFLETMDYQLIELRDPAELSNAIEENTLFCLLIHTDANTDAGEIETWKQTLQMNGSIEGKPDCTLVCLCESEGKISPSTLKDPIRAVLRNSDLRLFEHMLETIAAGSEEIPAE